MNTRGPHAARQHDDERSPLRCLVLDLHRHEQRVLPSTSRDHARSAQLVEGT